MKDIPNLDFVRSIAVISVVLEHTLLVIGIQRIGPFPIEWMGVLGVMVFFVLTSLVLMWSLERRPHTLDFYIRRWFRIYPLAIACVAIVLLFHMPVGGAPGYSHPGWRELVNQFLLLPIASSGPLPLGVTWTLIYEIEMYILLPAIFFFVQRNFSLWPMLLLWIVVIMNARRSPGHNFAVAIGYFLPGIMAYIGFGRWKPRLPGWMLAPFLLCLWAIFLANFSFHRCWWFCLIVGLSLPMFHQIKSAAVLAASRQIAKYSYGIYLTHPFAIFIGFYLFRAQSLPIRLSAEVISLIASALFAYHLLEHPMIRWGSRLATHAERTYEQQELKQYRQLAASAAD